MKRVYRLLFLSVFILAFGVRLYHINGPVADWHSWRQADTAAVARNFMTLGFDPFRPRYDDLSNIQSGKDNPMGYRMVEFPLYQSLAYFVKQGLQALPMEVVLRLITITFSALTALMIGVIVGNRINRMTGLLAALCFAVMPYSIYYGRSILPDPFMVFLAVASIFFLDTGEKKYWFRFFISALCVAGALLVKPFGIFLLLPNTYLLYQRFGLSKKLVIGALVYWCIGVFPLYWWRQWILQYPEGIAVYAWLFNEGNIRFKGAWFQWLFAERIGKLILGYWGLVPFGLGLLIPQTKKEGWIFRLWILGTLLYLIVIARGNVQHDYYQILLLPVVSVYLAKGFALLFSKSVFSRTASLGLAGTSFLFMLAFSWYTIRTFFWINHPEIVEAGAMADKLIPKDAKVIAPYNGDTTFLYQTHRQGWPIGFEIDKKIKAGATYYVTVSPKDSDGETRELARLYTVLVRTDTYAIIDLTKKK